ncbi:large ribosomal subunit protein mL55 [Phascolarctos cinereus]
MESLRAPDPRAGSSTRLGHKFHAPLPAATGNGGLPCPQVPPRDCEQRRLSAPGAPVSRPGSRPRAPSPQTLPVPSRLPSLQHGSWKAAGAERRGTRLRTSVPARAPRRLTCRPGSDGGGGGRSYPRYSSQLLPDAPAHEGGPRGTSCAAPPPLASSPRAVARRRGRGARDLMPPVCEPPCCVAPEAAPPVSVALRASPGRFPHRSPRSFLQQNLVKISFPTSHHLHTSSIQLNSNRASLTRVHRKAYARLYPVMLVKQDGSTIHIRYKEPRRILTMPVDIDTLSPEERKIRLRKRNPKYVEVGKEEAEFGDDFSVEQYAKFWKKN